MPSSGGETRDEVRRRVGERGADADELLPRSVKAQVDPYASETSELRRRYGPKVAQGDFDGDPSRLTRMDALIAYLQVLGTMVDFRTYEAEAPENLR